MGSKAFKILMTILTPLFLSGCWEFGNTPKSTRFVGKVIDNSSSLPITDGFVIFIGSNIDVIHLNQVIKDSVKIDPDGKFDFTLRVEDEKVSTIDIFVSYKPSQNNKSILVSGEAINCSPYNCNGIDPGKSYNFDIRVN